MSLSTGSGRRQDPTWKYTSLVDEGNANKHKCIFCNKITNGGISRQKEHLIGTKRARKNVTVCQKAPPDVVEELKEYQERQESARRQQAIDDYLPELGDENMVEIDEDEELEEEQLQATRAKGKGPMAATHRSSSITARGRGTLGLNSVGSSTKRKGPMDAFLTFDPALEVAKDDRRRKLRQTCIDESLNKDAIAKVHQDIARWWYQAGIPFNAARLRSFRIMLKSVGAFGPNLPPPTFHHLREPLLKKEKKYTEDLMKPHKEVWATKGCSFMSDGWSDRKDRSLFNFLVNSPLGTVFLSSIDASEEIKTGERMYQIFDEQIKLIGPQNVVQIVTDNHSSLKLAGIDLDIEFIVIISNLCLLYKSDHDFNFDIGKLLEAKYPHLYWTPCAAHCINLMLKDIGKLPSVKSTLSRAMELTGFIYSHGWVLKLMRGQTNYRELLRPAVTRFATSFMTLSSIHKQKSNLRKMFNLEKWKQSKWARDPKGKSAEKIVHMPSFWNNIVRIIKLTAPLVRVLKLVDSEKRPAMGYIYEAMDRSKEAIAKAFNNDATNYALVFEIIDKRWQDQLHQPLHAAGYYLNPAFFYDHPNIQGDDEVMKGLYQVIEKMVPIDEQDKIDKQLDIYRNVEGLFGMDIAKRNRKRKSPADWWESYGASAPELQKLAIRVLSLTCSSSGCERNWSTFEQIHSKKRNRLDHKRLQDLVYCKYNQALKERFDCRDVIDPIKLPDIDESNEWLLGKFGEGDNAENDLVEGEDDLTFGVVGDAMGAEEDDARYLRSTSRGQGFSSGGGSSSRRREPVSESEEEFNEEEETEEEDIPLEVDDDDVEEDD